MPLRSVKMYGFIRGSHLLVRCPKWTPLSSRAFIGITAMISPNFCRSPTRGAMAPARNGMSLVGIRLYEPDPLKDACCPSQARYVAPFVAPGRDYIIENRIHASP